MSERATIDSPEQLGPAERVISSIRNLGRTSLGAEKVISEEVRELVEDTICFTRESLSTHGGQLIIPALAHSTNTENETVTH